MGKRRQFTNEFKLEAVRLVERGDVSAAQVARDLGVCESVLSRWVKQFGRQANGTRVTSDEQAELIRLRGEIRRVSQEQNIPGRAAGIFSKELP